MQGKKGKIFEAFTKFHFDFVTFSNKYITDKTLALCRRLTFKSSWIQRLLCLIHNIRLVHLQHSATMINRLSIILYWIATFCVILVTKSYLFLMKQCCLVWGNRGLLTDFLKFASFPFYSLELDTLAEFTQIV